jgi:peptidoglycan/xylan/chitin deacetylase (PgdA/CDA1 family)
MSRRLPLTIVLTFALALAAAPQSAQQRTMAITVDDLPAQRAQSMSGEDLERTLLSLIELFEIESIPAIGFVNEVKLEVEGSVSPRRVKLLEHWLNAGLELGNHSYSHPDLHRIELAEFEHDVLLGERVSRPLAETRAMPWRFFRHPFLHTGLSLEIKHDLESFLADHGYRVAPVTIDNSEWIFAAAYDRAREQEDEELVDRVAATYLDYMESVVAFYEAQSLALFDREIPQALLVHSNPLNADHLGALIARLRVRGYRFIPLDEALEDPAYESADTYVGRGGITWLHRWALTREVDRAIFRGEPETPEWISHLAGIGE